MFEEQMSFRVTGKKRKRYVAFLSSQCLSTLNCSIHLLMQ